MKSIEKGEHQFDWPSLSDSEEELLTTMHLFAKALSYEVAPLLESIRSSAELLRGSIEELAAESRQGDVQTLQSKINVSMRLYYIAQNATTVRQILEKAHQLTSLRVKTVHGVEMLDLESCWPKEPPHLPLSF